MRRVMVVGGPGAGKTTFARRLASNLKLPLIHLDFHFWRPGWEASDATHWRATVARLAAAPDWIMDGNYSDTYDIRMPRADTLFCLDYPRSTRCYRALWRTLRGYGRNRPDLPEGCPEGFDFAFLRYVWEFQAEDGLRTADAIAQFGTHLRVIELRNDNECAMALAGTI